MATVDSVPIGEGREIGQRTPRGRRSQSIRSIATFGCLARDEAREYAARVAGDFLLAPWLRGADDTWRAL